MASIDNNVDRIKVLHPILMEEISKHKDRLSTVFPEDKEKMQIIDVEMIFGYFDMLQMAVSGDDYETADFVCEEIQRYNYPESVSNLVDELVVKVNCLDSDAVVELVDRIKGSW